MVRDRELARVVSTYNGKQGTAGFRVMFGTQEKVHPPLGVGFPVTLPAKVDQYFEPGATEWASQYQDDTIELASAPQRYRPGTFFERWNAPVLVPGFAGQGSAVRAGDAIKVRLTPHNDQDGHAGLRWGATSTKLFRGEVVVGQSEEFGTVEAGDLPAADSQYRLETAIAGTSLVAAFRSGAGDGPLPLRTVRFSPEVDAQSLMTRRPITVLPFSFDAQAGTPAAQKVEVQYSTDGKSWKSASVARSRVIFRTPAASRISLRATVTDRSGNTTTQTMLDAVELK